MTGHASGARIFDQARRLVSVEDLALKAGAKLKKAGRELRGLCPVCAAGAKSHSTPFAVKGEKWRCYSCGRFGDVVDLEWGLGGGTLLEAAQRLVGGRTAIYEPRKREDTQAEPKGPTTADRVAAELLSEARPFAGSLAERYLRHRGISATIVARAAPNLLFHPHAKHSWDPDAGTWRRAPAMLMPVVTVAGPTGGVHATYLLRSGLGKADLRPAKRMWGAQIDAQGRPGGAWLIGPDGEGDLATGEGAESVLSVATLWERKGLPLRAVAALSLNRLQGGQLRDAQGCADVYRPQPDPEHPPFTWPTAEAGGWDAVLVAVDQDMKPVRLKGRNGRGKALWFEIPGDARARLCGALACAGWRAAGAPKARIIAPPPGTDFNDELRRVLALESEA